MSSPIVMFEVPADDPKKLAGFYRDVFGWRIDKTPGRDDYWTIQTNDGSGPGVNGGLLKKVGPNSVPINYMQVDSIEEHCRKIEAAGGRISHARQAIPGIGWFAIAADPEGNQFGIFQEDLSALPER